MIELNEHQEKSEKSQSKCNRSARPSGTHLEDDSIVSTRRYNKAVRCCRKPSYVQVLGARTKSFRYEYRDRLTRILHELLRHHNWREASGVLSVLMQATESDRSAELNRLKYTALVHILKRLRPSGLRSSEINEIYDIWISKIGSEHKEEKLSVCLEQILHFLKDGNNEDAYQAASSLMQHREFGRCPRSYLVIGLTFYQLWYCKFLKELQSERVDVTPSQSETLDSRFDNPIGLSSGHEAVYSLDTEASARCDSETSVACDKRISHMSISESEIEMSVKVDANLKMDSPSHLTQRAQPVLVYATSDENQTSLQNDVAYAFNPSLVSLLEGMESWLLPVTLPKDHDYYIQMLNDSNYKEAVKYMQLALHCSPPVSLAALHPLVQLLLIGGQVDEAMKEVEEVCNNVGDVQAFRIRATILETFQPDSDMLAKSYEDVLKMDGTCSRTVTKLVNMHDKGDYSVESLIEMIALHLEASYPRPDMWRAFASCFLKLFQCDEDRMSVCLGGARGEQTQRYSVHYNRTPKIFTGGRSGKAWKTRCRWWLTRHFSPKRLDLDIKKGDMQLMTYKASCACHMYGQEFGYVLKVYSLLEDYSDKDLFMFLQTHRYNSIGIYNPDCH